jgi:hypothetical protein
MHAELNGVARSSRCEGGMDGSGSGPKRYVPRRIDLMPGGVGENPDLRYDCRRKEDIAMPHRFQVFERIAFSLVVLSAVACSAYIAYETDPDVRQVLHAGKTALQWSGQYSFICASPVTDACANLPVD